MAKRAMKGRPAKTPASIDFDAGLAGIAAMNVEQLRDLWRQKRGQEPPAAFSKELLARALAYWLQEEVLGGLDARVRKLLSATSARRSGNSSLRRAGCRTRPAQRSRACASAATP